MSALPPGFELIDNPTRGATPSLPSGFELVGAVPAAPTGPMPSPVLVVPEGRQTIGEAVRAGLRGFADGATFGFSDEMAAAQAAAENVARRAGPIGEAAVTFGNTLVRGLPGVGLVHGALQAAQTPPRPGESMSQAYNRVLDETRAQQRADEERQWAARLAGQVAGGVAVPVGAGAQGVRALAGIGAATGGLYGIGSGEGAADRIAQGALGGVVGGIAGGAIGGVAQAIGNRVARPTNPDAVAAGRITRAFELDNITNPAERLATLRADGMPAVLGDAGGEATRALARSAANTSLAGRNAAAEEVGNRFAQQTARTQQLLNDITGATGDVNARRIALQEQARAANRANYAAAENAPAARAVWDSELERLMGSETFREAARTASSRGTDRSVAQGMPPVRNPFVFREDGSVSLRQLDKQRTVDPPNLTYWDHVQRNLREMSESATGARRNDIEALRAALNRHLDAMVPEFRAARSGAAAAFGADDALTAGRDFVHSRMENPDARRALAKMSEPERRLFREGFAEQLVSRVREIGDSADVVRQIAGSPAARERLEIALGPNGAKRFLTRMEAEKAARRLENAIFGGSTTARQQYELQIAGGLAGGATAMGMGADVLTTGGVAAVSAFAAASVRRAMQERAIRIDERVARRVIEMLTSNNAGDINKIAGMMQRQPAVRNYVEFVSDALARGSGQQIGGGAGTSASNAIQGLLPGSAPAVAGAQQQDQGQQPR